jgi:dTDP-4-dehydrorhamnose 3,5-epimerase
MLSGIAIKPLRRIPDERGSFAEVMRADWKEVFGDEILQANMSVSYPGTVRAWHKHERGQIDRFVVIRGALKICAYDDDDRELAEIISTGESPQVVKVPGHYWHGFRAIGNESSVLVYFVNKLYDKSDPDEVRRPWNDASIAPRSINGSTNDPRCNEPWDWLARAYK